LFFATRQAPGGKDGQVSIIILGFALQNYLGICLETNELLSLIHSLSKEIEEIKNGDSIKNDQISALVTPRGNSSPPKAPVRPLAEQRS
jgi:hypothetical protein